MDAEKQKALDAVAREEPYHVRGKLCHTAADVNAAWAHPVEAGEPTPPKKAAKRAKAVAEKDEATSIAEEGPKA